MLVYQLQSPGDAQNCSMELMERPRPPGWHLWPLESPASDVWRVRLRCATGCAMTQDPAFLHPIGFMNWWIPERIEEISTGSCHQKVYVIFFKGGSAIRSEDQTFKSGSAIRSEDQTKHFWAWPVQFHPADTLNTLQTISVYIPRPQIKSRTSHTNHQPIVTQVFVTIAPRKCHLVLIHDHRPIVLQRLGPGDQPSLERLRS